MNKSLETIKDEYARENQITSYKRIDRLDIDCAIDEISTRYAENVAKDFSEWIAKNEFQYDKDKNSYLCAYKIIPSVYQSASDADNSKREPIYFTTEQLYQLYKDEMDKSN